MRGLILHPRGPRTSMVHAKGTITMPSLHISKVPSEDDPAQLPIEPEFPTDEDPTNPHSDEGEPGADENAAGFVKKKI